MNVLGFSLVWSLLLACLLPLTAHSQGKPDLLPIVDVHFHYMLFMKPQDLLDRMNKNGIAAIVSAGAIGSPQVGNPTFRDNEALQVLRQRFIPASGSADLYIAEKQAGTKLYTDTTSSVRSDAFARLSEQRFAGRRSLPETFPNAESTSNDPMRRRRVPTDSPYFVELMQIAIANNIPLPMHMEWHPESAKQLGNLLTRFPNGSVLLSHCGSVSSADEIRKFFAQHSNIFCDLGFRGMPQLALDRLRDQGRTVYWSASLFQSAGIHPAWLQLMEDYPDRFMMAIDDVLSWEQYDQIVESIRQGVLAKLTPATAEKVAYKNAMKLFQLPAAVLEAPGKETSNVQTANAPAARSDKGRWISSSRIAKDLVFPDAAQPLTAASQPEMALYKPEGAGPFPALVLLHQCGGLRDKNWRNASMLDWARQAVQQGYVALVLDSLSQRNVDSVCFGAKGGVNFGRGVRDTLQAAEHLSKFDFVDADRMALVGFSWGAMNAVLASGKAWADELRLGTRFRSAAAFYPGCAPIFPASGSAYEVVNADIDRPLLVLMGQLDNETPAADCVSRLQQVRSSNAPVEWHVYPDTGHCWDCKNLDGYSKVDSRGTSVTYRYSAEVSADSARRLFEFLSRTMPTTR